MMKSQKIFIISGAQGAGKTTKLLDVVRKLKAHKLTLTGFAAPGYWDENQRSGFDLLAINSGETHVLCRSDFDSGDRKIGRFYFNTSTIEFGESLLPPKSQNADLFVIDEIGRFELENQVWSNLLLKLLSNPVCHVLMTVRTGYVDEVVEKFHMPIPFVFSMEMEADEIARQLLYKIFE